MADSFFSFSLILHALLLWLAWKTFSTLFSHLQLIVRIRQAGIPSFHAYPVLGILVLLSKCLLLGSKLIPANAVLMLIGSGMAKVFSKEGMIRVDLGWVKQVIVVYSKEAVKAILNDPREQKKSVEYKFLKDFVGEGLLTASYGKWKKQKRVLSPAFNTRVLDSFQPVMYQYSHVLVQRIKSEIRSRRAVAIEDLIPKCTLEIVTDTAMGTKSFSCSDNEVAFVTAVRAVLQIISLRIVTPWLWPDFIFRLSPSGWKLRKNMRTVNSFVREIIREKKAEIKETSTYNPTIVPGTKFRPFLELLLLHNVSCRESDRLTDEDILDETLTFTFAGFDTVSTTLLWTIYYIGLHPVVMTRVWTEIDTIMQGDKGREILLDDLIQMEYLEKVIMEAQRIRPSVAVLARTIRHDITVGAFTLPKGATVVVNVEELHRRPDAFPDGEKFDPDRFTDAKFSSFQFIPFSAGPRKCIGQRFAVLEMKTILSNMIRHLNWKSLDQEDEVLSEPHIVNRPHKKLNINFWERL